MWLNEHRRGPGWKRFLSARRLCRFLLVLLPKQCGRGAAGAERLPPDRCLSWGLLRALVRSARRHGARGLRVSGTRAPGSRLPASRARISCRGSRAPGAAPSDCTTSARGGGGGAGPLKSTARPPDPPARCHSGRAWTAGKGLLGCDSGSGRWTLTPPTAPSVSGAGKIHFSWSVHAGFFLRPFLIFSFYHCDLMALVILDHTEVKPLNNNKKKL